MEKSKGAPSSQLVGGAIRQELDRLWAEIRRVQPIAGAGQRARYTTGGVIIESQCCGGESQATGSCCDGESCEVTTEEECLTPFVWLAAGTCAPNNCVTPTMSCCVDATGVCTLETFADCGAIGLLTPTTWGASLVCDPNPCGAPPPATGACCDAAGACTIQTEAACIADAATYQGDDTACEPNPCGVPPPPPATGSCCNQSLWQCTTTTAAACFGGGVWTEAGNCGNCAPSPPPSTGACCVAGVCSETTQIWCANIGGTFPGAGIFCTPDPCGAPPPPPDIGSCCYSTVSSGGGLGCQETTQAECLTNPIRLTPAWTQGAACLPNPCVDPMGTCCGNSTGACENTTGPNCPNTSFWTIGQTCAENPCTVPPGLGACCSGYGCTGMTTEAACGSPSWRAGLFCFPDPCTTGTCCAADDSCSITTAAACLAVAGSAWSVGGACTPNPCATPPPTGACCADGSCIEAMTAIGCAAIAGVFHVGLACAAAPCGPPLGTCCAFFPAACASSLEADCLAPSTWFEGFDGTCAPCAALPAVGRCCAGDGTCSMTTQAGCAGIDWQEGYRCDVHPCPQPPTGSCCKSGGVCMDSLAPMASGTAIGGGQCEANENYIEGVFCAARSCLGGCCWYHPYIGNVCTQASLWNEFDCLWGSGTTFHPGGDCFSCTQYFTADFPGGACCDMAGGCTLTRFADCVGLWLPDDTCWQDGCPSPSTGACCRMVDGIPDCHLDTAENCDATGGQFTPNTVCADVLCPPEREITGACCDAWGFCFDGLTVLTCPATSTFNAGVDCIEAACVPFTG